MKLDSFRVSLDLEFFAFILELHGDGLKEAAMGSPSKDRDQTQDRRQVKTRRRIPRSTPGSESNPRRVAQVNGRAQEILGLLRDTPLHFFAGGWDQAATAGYNAISGPQEKRPPQRSLITPEERVYGRPPPGPIPPPGPMPPPGPGPGPPPAPRTGGVSGSCTPRSRARSCIAL